MDREHARGLAHRAICDGRLDRTREEDNLADVILAAVADERRVCAMLADIAAEDCLLHREQAQAEIAWQIAGTIRSRV